MLESLTFLNPYQKSVMTPTSKTMADGVPGYRLASTVIASNGSVISLCSLMCTK